MRAAPKGIVFWPFWSVIASFLKTFFLYFYFNLNLTLQSALEYLIILAIYKSNLIIIIQIGHFGLNRPFPSPLCLCFKPFDLHENEPVRGTHFRT